MCGDFPLIPPHFFPSKKPMSEKKKLLELLQASLEADEKASSSNADTLICDAKTEVHKLNLYYKEEMDKIYTEFITKIDDDSEENGWDDDLVDNLKAEIQEITMTGIHNTEEEEDEDEDEEEEEVVEEEEDATEDDDVEEVASPSKKRGRAGAGKGKGKAAKSPSSKKAKKAPAKPAPKKIGKSASSRPRGRTPGNMQWSESEGKWVPMKAALRRVVGEAPAGTIWNEEKQEFVPLKAALKRLM